jgi:hypothetical protein
LEAGNTIMPPTDSVSSGKSSVCAAPARCASRSASLPGTADAWGVNESRPAAPTETLLSALAWVRSATKITASTATSSTVPCRNSVGRSIATAPSTALRPEADSERLTSTTATNAAIRPPRASVTWVP